MQSRDLPLLATSLVVVTKLSNLVFPRKNGQRPGREFVRSSIYGLKSPTHIWTENKIRPGYPAHLKHMSKVALSLVNHWLSVWANRIFSLGETILVLGETLHERNSLSAKPADTSRTLAAKRNESEQNGGGTSSRTSVATRNENE